MNEEDCIYRESFHMGLGWNAGFTHKKHEKTFSPALFQCMGRTHHALGAWMCFLGPNSSFFRRFRCLLPNKLSSDLRTDLLRPLKSSFLISPRPSQIFRCYCFADLHDFFVNYFKNTLILLCFGKTIIID